VIDTATETVLPFSKAAKRVPARRADKPTSPSTLWRWSSTGCLARDGTRVRLETIRIGGSTCTSVEALARFFARLTGEAPALFTPEQPHGKRHHLAEASLDAAGI
jgi:hypothetical protein